MNAVHSFPKSERLCSRKDIEALFASGNRAFSAFPLRVVFREAAETKVLISVSKRRFKHAVDRNRAKRQMREAWRLNRDILPATPLHLAFIWLADEPQPSELVHRKMKNLLHRISEL
jgi:ribonuclease P protein component